MPTSTNVLFFFAEVTSLVNLKFLNNTFSALQGVDSDETTSFYEFDSGWLLELFLYYIMCNIQT